MVLGEEGGEAERLCVVCLSACVQAMYVVSVILRRTQQHPGRPFCKENCCTSMFIVPYLLGEQRFRPLEEGAQLNSLSSHMGRGSMVILALCLCLLYPSPPHFQIYLSHVCDKKEEGGKKNFGTLHLAQATVGGDRNCSSLRGLAHTRQGETGLPWGSGLPCLPASSPSPCHAAFTCIGENWGMETRHWAWVGGVSCLLLLLGLGTPFATERGREGRTGLDISQALLSSHPLSLHSHLSRGDSEGKAGTGLHRTGTGPACAFGLVAPFPMLPSMV